MGLFCFQMKIDLGLPELFPLLQKDDKESVLGDSHSFSFLFDILVHPARDADLR